MKSLKMNLWRGFYFLSFILLIFIGISCHSTPEEKALRKIKTYDQFAQFISRMQNNLKGYYAKGDIKANIEDANREQLRFEIWVRMPQPPEVLPSFHYTELFPIYEDERVIKYDKSEILCNGKISLWFGPEKKNQKKQEIYIFDCEKMHEAELPLSFIIGTISVAQISYLLHYGRLIEMESWAIPSSQFNPRIKYLRKEKKGIYKDCYIFEQKEALPKIASIKAKVWIDPSNGLMRRYERKESIDLFSKPEIVMEINELRINPPELETMSFDFPTSGDAHILDQTEMHIKGYKDCLKELERGGKLFPVEITIPE